jgi:non-specific protein-tyrosine kinase
MEHVSMELRLYLAWLRQYWWVLAAGALAAGAVAFVVSQQMPSTYKAEATLVVFSTPSTPDDAAPDDLVTDERLTNTYAGLIERSSILDDVIRRLRLDVTSDELDEKITARAVEETQLIEIVVSDEDPEQAAAIANTTAQAFIDDTLWRVGGLHTISIASAASPPADPSSPNIALNTAIAAILGVVLAGCVAALMEHLDDTLKTPEAVSARSGLATLASIPFMKLAEGGNALANRLSSSERYATLRAQVNFARQEHGVRTLIIAGPHAGEGKSTTAANLAVAYAQTGERVILVDADLRTGSLAVLFGVTSLGGLSGVLKSSVGVDDALIPIAENLSLLPAGSRVTNPSELIASVRMTGLIEDLRRRADLIILDTPSMSEVSDAAVLAARVDAVLLVIDPRKTRAGSLGAVLTTLRRANARVAGVVLNRSRPSPAHFEATGTGTAASSTTPDEANSGLARATQGD